MSEKKIMTVDERLHAAADLFKQRNAAYGDNYRTIGPVLAAMYPNGLTIKTEGEWQRLFTIVMSVMKTTRYAQNISKGGHADSLEDLSVYAQMGNYTDALENETNYPIQTAEPRSMSVVCDVAVGDKHGPIAMNIKSIPHYRVAHSLSVHVAFEKADKTMVARRTSWAIGHYNDVSALPLLSEDNNLNWELWAPCETAPT